MLANERRLCPRSTKIKTVGKRPIKGIDFVSMKLVKVWKTSYQIELFCYAFCYKISI